MCKWRNEVRASCAVDEPENADLCYGGNSASHSQQKPGDWR